MSYFVLAVIAWTVAGLRPVTSEGAAPLTWPARLLISLGYAVAQIWLGLVLAGAVQAALLVLLSAISDHYHPIWAVIASDGLMLLLGAAVAVLAVAASAVVCLLAYPRGGFLTRAALRAAIHDHWTAAAARQLPPALALGTAILGVFVTATVMTGMDPIAETRNLPWHGDPLTMMAEFPMLPLALLGSGVALAAYHGLALGHAGAAATGGASPSGPLQLPLTVFVALAVLSGVYVNAGSLRTGLVAAFTLVPAIAPTVETDTAVRGWIGERTAAGDAPADIAAKLNEFGEWDSALPDQGLIELLPALAETYGADKDVSCHFRIRADMLSDVETAALPPAADDEAVLPVKFCLRSYCWQPPVTRERESRAWLFSSHASANPGWAEMNTAATLSDEVPGAGGFCTRDGDLAESYQG
ncbi:MAG: hypothetical protein QGF53_13500 [Alphaproteobacteria bacterium]|nr:hypothetical protein [Alphaproteobacteria bacterium]